ncbi:MAG: GatB/YqeY domain-containing protein [Bryobacteraceae bacterium]|nr:GatB/YqeY domain-containing protein [Solibacteraceae bacterium]MCO5351211.1 GatB/YqeY domain-containing protein [Bryobacteraceae bacterium]
MPLLDKLQKDMVAAMKAKEELKLGTIRMVKTALMKEKVDSMKELDEAAEMRILNMLLKQRRESVEMYRQGGREEQAAKEEAEIAIIEAYMPAMATEEEIGLAIEAALTETGATTAKQMGLVMKAAQARLAGKRVDGRALSEQVKARLSA